MGISFEPGDTGSFYQHATVYYFGVNMDDDEVKYEDNTPEQRLHLSKPMSRLEVISLVQPLRGALMPLFQASMSSLTLLITHSNDDAMTDKARKSFDELKDIFRHIDNFHARLDRIYQGKAPFETEDKELTDD
jgi:hypothetical protein